MTNAATTKPYLIRAIYEWCVDYGHTPYLSVRVDATTKVPVEYIKNGEIVLNVSQTATRNLKIDNEKIQFSARFNGVSREVLVPMLSVAAIFAKENGQGLVFQTDKDAANAQPEPPSNGPGSPRPSPPAAPSNSGSRAHLKVVK